MIKIGVIGLGNMGRRYLQSIASMPEEKEIFCYDIFDGSFNLLKDFLKDNNLDIPNLKFFKTIKEFFDYITPDSIIIVTTTAKGRVNILKSISAKKPRAILAEKPVCQTLEEYNELLKLKDCPIYINFFRHCSADYISLKKHLRGAKIKEIIIRLNEGGLVCNGIHMLDLFVWLLNTDKYEIINAQLGEVFNSKRVGYYDFDGRIEIKIGDTKCKLILDTKIVTEQIEIKTADEIINIYEQLGKIVYISANSLTNFIFTVPFQSQLTAEVIKNILDSNQSHLPTLDRAYQSHKIIFEVMTNKGLKHLNVT